MKTNLIQTARRIPWLLLALVSYYLPWVYHRAAALTFNANDLAEWTSLSPLQRTVGIMLIVPFLLRALLLGLAIVYGLQAAQEISWRRWLYAILALILAITLMPPSEFFKGAWADPNYRQQAGLALCAFIALAAIAVARARLQRSPVLLILLLALMILAGTAGDVMALSVVRAYQIDATIGGGVIAWCVCLGIHVALVLSAGRREAALSGTIPEFGKIQQ